MVMEVADKDALTVKYIPYDAGGKAMAALLSGEIAALSTGFSEAVDLGFPRRSIWPMSVRSRSSG